MKQIDVMVLFLVLMFSANSFAVSTDDLDEALGVVKTEIMDELSIIDKDIASSVDNLAKIDFKSDEARKILFDVCKDRPYVSDFGIIDKEGKLVTIEPEKQRQYEGSFVGDQAQVKEALEKKSPLLSNVFAALDGKLYIDFLYPIFSENKEFLGFVSLLIRHDEFLKSVITELANNKPYKIWVMQTDGFILYDADPNQINKNIFSDEMFKGFEDLITFSKGVSQAAYGIGSYDFYKEGLTDKTIVKKDAAWDSVGLYGKQWRIIAMEIEAD